MFYIRFTCVKVTYIYIHEKHDLDIPNYELI